MSTATIIEPAPDVESLCAGALARMLETERNRKLELAAFLSTVPTGKPCREHPDVLRHIDPAASERLSREYGRHIAAYTPCPRCAELQAQRREQEPLRRAGVPELYLGATFDNWKPRSPEEAEHLAKAREWADKQPRGALVLLGGVGTGKTHLAVACMRSFRRPWFTKQSSLLGALRATYRNRDAVDPMQACCRAQMLVLDEVGLSAGGRDELPLIHDVLDHFHTTRKPLVLTGNCGVQELPEILGDRVYDRLRESAFAILTFGGESYRKQARASYFQAEPAAARLPYKD